MQLLSVALFCLAVVCVLGDCPENYCGSGQTCCSTPSGYECCQFPNATCCSDGKRCCPEGMECGLTLCTPPSPSTLEKRRLTTESTTEEDATIPIATTTDEATDPIATTTDEATDPIATTTDVYSARLNLCNRRSYCPHTYECCIEPSGGYNCCPPNSICCPNSGHCCPEGTLCDLDVGTCRPNIPFSKRQGLIENYDMNEANINRCDKQFYCPDEYSCCMKPNGEYGCCPYPNAVCCSDRLHCCQQGEVCDGTSEMCFRDEVVMPPSDMEKAVPFLTEDGDF